MLVATQEMIERLQAIHDKCHRVVLDLRVVANLHNDIPTDSVYYRAIAALEAVKAFQVDLEELMRKP